jgi:hypothetical protein
MDEDAVRSNIKSALQALIGKGKQDLHALYDKSDDDGRVRREKLRRLFEALTVLKLEVGGAADISIALAGHVATVNVNTLSSSHRLTISTNYDRPANTFFVVEEHKYYSFSSDSYEHEYRLATEEDVLRLVLDAVAKSIASSEVLAERK